ncbi:MAG TPA: hypothetical protein VM759_13380 [Longimicrobium sp.]|nr:hypothetical protein [Longimicrobium sp.]
MKIQISTVVALCAVLALAACGSMPTTIVTPDAWQADAVPSDTTGRVPNLFGSGN